MSSALPPPSPAAIARLRGIRHAPPDPARPSVFGIDPVEVSFDGISKDGYVAVEGVARETPSLSLKALLVRIED